MEGGQVVEFRGPFSLVLPGDGLDQSGLAQAGRPQFLRVCLGIEFAAGCPKRPQIQLHSVEFFLLEILNRRLPLGQQRESRGQHPAHVQRLAFIKAGKQPGPVNANKPVRLGAAEGGGVEVVVLFAVCQIIKALADSGFLHRGNPKPLDGLRTSTEVVGQPEDQFALPSGIGGADHSLHIVPAHKLAQNVELLLGVRQHLELPRVRENGEIAIGPLGIAGVIGVSRGQFHQMADTPAHQPAVALHITVPAGSCTQHLRQRHGNTRFFSDH